MDIATRNPFRPSLTLDDSLDQQIELLRNYVSNISPPESPILQSPKPRNSKLWENRLSLALSDEQDLGLGSELDRALMCKQDFLSHEMRRALEYPKNIYGDAVQTVKCSIYELYSLQQQIEEIIALTQERLKFEGEVSIGHVAFTIQIQDEQGQAFAEKDYFINLIGKDKKHQIEFNRENHEALKRTNKNLYKQTLIPKHIEELGKSIEISMKSAFNVRPVEHSLEVSLLKNGLQQSLRSPAVLQMELRNLQTTKDEHQKLKSTFAWEAAQLSRLTSDNRIKEQSLNKKSAFLAKQGLILKDRMIQFEKQRDFFEYELEQFEDQKRAYQDYKAFNRDKIAQTKAQILELMTNATPIKKPEPRLYSRPSTPTQEDPRIEELRTEIAKLQQKLYTSSSQERESISIRLARNKTQLSNLRSQRAIASSLASSQNYTNAMQKKFSRSFCTTPDRSFDGRNSSRDASIGSIDFEIFKPTASPGLPRPPVKDLRDEMIKGRLKERHIFSNEYASQEKTPRKPLDKFRPKDADIQTKQKKLDEEINNLYFRKLLIEDKLSSLIECFYQ